MDRGRSSSSSSFLISRNKTASVYGVGADAQDGHETIQTCQVVRTPSKALWKVQNCITYAGIQHRRNKESTKVQQHAAKKKPRWIQNAVQTLWSSHSEPMLNTSQWCSAMVSTLQSEYFRRYAYVCTLYAGWILFRRLYSARGVTFIIGFFSLVCGD